MVITVKFIGVFRSASGKGKLSLNFGNTVLLREAIKEMARQLPQIKRLLIDPELEDPRPNTLMLVNGKEIGVLNGLDTVLEDGDEVVLVPVVHGG
jgi:molybdopterin converting factor small subunit